MAQIFGYARVSTREQNEARQLLALREFGVEDERIFTDRQSGKDFDRPAYRRLVRRLRPGDTLAVKSIDRLGRNYREILEQWRILTHERRVGVVVLDMPLLDTRQERDLAGTLTADIVLQLLSYVAETERVLIRQRQAEGIAAGLDRFPSAIGAPGSRGAVIYRGLPGMSLPAVPPEFLFAAVAYGFRGQRRIPFVPLSQQLCISRMDAAVIEQFSHVG